MNTRAKFQSIWEYEVKVDKRSEFIHAYHSNGLWSKLFRRCKGYIKTELLQDLNQPNRFITTDDWESHAAFSEMKQTIGDAYIKLDQQCEAYTLSEKHIGYFGDV